MTQWVLPTGISGETRVVGALRTAQNLLGILGIESTVEVRGD